MDISGAVRDRIKQLLKEKHMTAADLPRIDPDIKRGTLGDFMTGRNKTITVATLGRICAAMGITPKEFFDDEVFARLSLHS